MIKFSEFLEGKEVHTSSTCGSVTNRPEPNKNDKRSTKGPKGVYNVHGNQGHN